MRKRAKISIALGAIYIFGLLVTSVIASQYCEQYFMEDDEPAFCNYFINEPSFASDVLAFTTTIAIPACVLRLYATSGVNRK